MNPTESVLADVAHEADSRPRPVRGGRRSNGKLIAFAVFLIIASGVGIAIAVLMKNEKEAKPAGNQPVAQNQGAAGESGEEGAGEEPGAEEEAEEEAPKTKTKTKTKGSSKAPVMIDEPEMMEQPEVGMDGKSMGMEDEPSMEEPAEPEMEEVDPAQAVKMKAALLAVKAALGKRDFDLAEKQMAKAKALATAPQLEESVERWELISGYVQDYWKAVTQSIQRTEPGEELMVGSTTLVMVEASEEQLVVHVGGENREYAIPAGLPSGLVRYFAEAWYDKTKPQNKVFMGAFALVDSKKGPEEARKLWEEAAEAGIDVKFLMPLVAEDGAVPSAEEVAAAQAPPPDAKTLAATEKTVRKLLGAELTGAKSLVNKAALAQKLLDDSVSAEDEPTRYVYLTLARDLANDADDTATMIKCVDELGAWFKIDPLSMKAEALAKATPSNAAAAKELATSGLALVKEALSAKNYEAAATLSKATMAAAKKSKDVALLKTVTAQSKAVLAKVKKTPAPKTPASAKTPAAEKTPAADETSAAE